MLNIIIALRCGDRGLCFWLHKYVYLQPTPHLHSPCWEFIEFVLKISSIGVLKFGSAEKKTYLCIGFRTDVHCIENRARFRCMSRRSRIPCVKMRSVHQKSTPQGAKVPGTAAGFRQTRHALKWPI